jgi:hypothetical protein
MQSRVKCIENSALPDMISPFYFALQFIGILPTSKVKGKTTAAVALL